MIVVERITALRRYLDAARSRGATVGFVPTMGAFHDGHRSLMRAARAGDDVVVVSIFVNPLQFNVVADLDRYPRDLEADAAVADEEGVDVVFAPSLQEMYPEPVSTTVHVAGVSEGLCGAARPGHFDGVATVVAKLFAIVGPCHAYFGEKDAQQLAVVRRLATDLNLPVEVIGCPLVREPDGLALSSRNVHLSAEQRASALVLSRALFEAERLIHCGDSEPDRVLEGLRSTIAAEPGIELEYAAVVDPTTMVPLAELVPGRPALVAVAAFAGTTRLIDNVFALAGSPHHLTTNITNESEASCAAG